MAKTRKSPPSGKGAAKSTVSGPRRGPRGTNGDGADPAVAKMQKTQALAAAFPFNRNKPGEFGDAARTPKPGATAEPADASVTASTLTEQTKSPKTGAPRGARPQSRQRAARPRARRLRRPGAHDELRAAHRRQPELAQGRTPGPRAPRGLHPPGEDHALRPRAHPRADRARPRLRRARRVRVLRLAGEVHARRLPVGEGQAHPGLRALLDRRGRAGVHRHGARRARLRDQVLHRRGELRPRREQHPDLLHPGRDEVPGPGARGQARAAPRDAPGGERPRHVLGLRLPDAGVDPHAAVGHVRPRAASQLQHDAGLRGPHVPAGQRRRRVPLREVPLDAAGGHALPRLGRVRQDRRARIPTTTAATCGSRSSPASSRSTSSAFRSSPRRRPRRSASTCSTRRRSCRRSWSP